jgi:hypothetical protein
MPVKGYHSRLRKWWPAFSFSKALGLFGVGAAFVVAALVRLWPAPYSAGVDVPQFWAFARVFQEHGLDFYRYADATLPIFPVQGWSFVYPPVWLFSLRMSIWAVPGSLATNDMISMSWRLAEKAPIIAADLVIGGLIYWAVGGPKWRRLLFAAVWLFNPAVWYQSALFGQFDAIAAGFLLGSVLAFERKHDRLAFLLAGLALMTKQYMVLPVFLLLVVSLRGLGWRKTAGNLAVVAGTVVLFSLPFILVGGAFSYAKMVLVPGQGYDYGNPLCYVFSGSKSLLEYLHQAYGWQTFGWLRLNLPLLGVAMVVAAVVCYRKAIPPLLAALVALLLFIGLSYQVNYQYLVAFIPLAVLAAARARALDRVMSVGVALLPAAWVWLFDVSLWFVSYDPQYPDTKSIFGRLGIGRNVPDFGYVIFAMSLTVLSLAYVVRVLARRPKGRNLAERVIDGGSRT